MVAAFFGSRVVGVKPISIERLQRYVIQPGDRLLVTVPRHTPSVERVKAQSLFQEWAPGVPVLIVSEDVDVSVVEGEALGR